MNLLGKTIAGLFSSKPAGQENVEFPTQEVMAALVKYARELVEEHLQTHPYQVLGMAFGAGCLLGGYAGKRNSLWWTLAGKRVTKWLARRAVMLVAQQVMTKMVSSKRMQRTQTEE